MTQLMCTVVHISKGLSGLTLAKYYNSTTSQCCYIFSCPSESMAPINLVLRIEYRLKPMLEGVRDVALFIISHE